MKTTTILFLILAAALTSCQSVPAERKNDCVCEWNTMRKISGGQA